MEFYEHLLGLNQRLDKEVLALFPKYCRIREFRGVKISLNENSLTLEFVEIHKITPEDSKCKISSLVKFH